MAENGTPSRPPVSVLFVCLGNICRSPMAEAIFTNYIHTHPSPSITFSSIDSAGTGAYHAGDDPDPRTMATLRRHNINGYSHLARKVTDEDFVKFDYLLAMDMGNLETLLARREKLLRGRDGKGGVRSAWSGAGGNTRSSSAASVAAGLEAGRIAEVRLFGDYLADGTVCEEAGGGREVDDPYYGGGKGFEVNFGLIGEMSKGFLKYLEREAGT